MTCGIRPVTFTPCCVSCRIFSGLLVMSRTRADAEAVEHVGGDGVVALVVAEAEREVGLHRVEPLLLERVGPDLVEEPDAAPLLAQVEQHPALVPLDRLQPGGELVAAVAAERAQHVAGQALGVEPDRHLARRRPRRRGPSRRAPCRRGCSRSRRAGSGRSGSGSSATATTCTQTFAAPNPSHS